MTEVDLSILMPAYNEADNLPEVVEELVAVLGRTTFSFEIVVVDDGSTDDTPGVLEKCGERWPELRWLRFRRNVGKSAALQAGFDHVRGTRVVLMDADGQDDPTSVPLLLASLDGGLDLVTGRRAERNDRFVKRSTSRLYNWTTSKITGVPGRDFNSGLKAMRREVVQELDLYGELHRYIPVLAHSAGFKVGEIDVPHRSRLHGESKFGSARFWRGFFDLITVKFLTTYRMRPFHILGGVGALSCLLGAVLLSWMLIERLLGEPVGSRPALTAGVLLFLVGIQLVSLGLIAELLVSMSRRSKDRDWHLPALQTGSATETTALSLSTADHPLNEVTGSGKKSVQPPAAT